jgi:hypothetical protein
MMRGQGSCSYTNLDCSTEAAGARFTGSPWPLR